MGTFLRRMAENSSDADLHLKNHGYTFTVTARDGA